MGTSSPVTPNRSATSTSRCAPSSRPSTRTPEPGAAAASLQATRPGAAPATASAARAPAAGPSARAAARPATPGATKVATALKTPTAPGAPSPAAAAPKRQHGHGHPHGHGHAHGHAHGHGQGHGQGHDKSGASAGPVGLVRQAAAGQELLLMPGQLYFGREPGSIRTLLGSCVALTLWHPERRIGGMCHYLLPERRRNPQQQPDGRYGTEAIAVLVEQLIRAGTKANEYEVHLYGGADTLPDHVAHKTQVGVRNIELGWTLVDQHGFQLVGVDVGDNVPRTVRLDMRSGAVDMRRSER